MDKTKGKRETASDWRERGGAICRSAEIHRSQPDLDKHDKTVSTLQVLIYKRLWWRGATWERKEAEAAEKLPQIPTNSLQITGPR